MAKPSARHFYKKPLSRSIVQNFLVMTTAFNPLQQLGQARKSSFENMKPNLYSPITLLLLLALLFTFFLTASGRNGYGTAQEREIIRTESTREEKSKASALRYERIVTSADPIRSMLQ